MWGHEQKTTAESPENMAQPHPLVEAIRRARIEQAERTGVVVDLRDAETARLEILNEALDPLFADIPPNVELFDRGVSRGEPPRLWIDIVAHVMMARDKRVYRFVQDSRFGRKVLAESTDIPEVVGAVTQYVARRLVERERALSGDSADEIARRAVAPRIRRHPLRAFAVFVFGAIIGAAALLAAAWLIAGQP